MLNDTPAHALTYAGTLPGTLLRIGAGEKKPVGNDWNTSATTDPDTLRHWFEGGAMNLGFQPDAGAFVLDIDMKEDGDGQTGFDSLADLEKVHGALPATLRQRTPSGGEHRFFRLPAGVTLRNRVGFRHGLDIRAQGSQVVVCPSRTPAGAYTWANWEPLEGAPPELAMCPSWLIDVMQAGKPAKATPVRVSEDADDDLLLLRVRHALHWLATNCPKDYASYEAWKKVLLCLHPAGLEAEALAFSRMVPGFDKAAFTQQWGAISDDSPELLGLPTLIREASSKGWDECGVLAELQPTIAKALTAIGADVGALLDEDFIRVSNYLKFTHRGEFLRMCRHPALKGLKRELEAALRGQVAAVAHKTEEDKRPIINMKRSPPCQYDLRHLPLTN